MKAPKDQEPVVATGDEKQTVAITQTSVDKGNGVVVFATDAEDGVGFTAKIDGLTLDATAKDGQVWFYAGRSLSEAPIIELL